MMSRGLTVSATVVLFAVLIPPDVQADAISDYFCSNSDSISNEYVDCSDSATPGGPGNSTQAQLAAKLHSLLATAASNGNSSSFLLPESHDYKAIPQDPANPLTVKKVKLGKLLFHETAFATEGVKPALAGTWSCASCHHAAAGFKAGIRQGIAEGGEGFGLDGSLRTLADGFGEEGIWQPDVQPVASPTILNVAFQDVLLWNGQFGNAVNGIVNSDLPNHILAPPGTPKQENSRNLSGVETQAVAGIGVHRMRLSDDDTALQTIKKYRRLYRKAFPDGGEILQNAALAIAAYERTVLANRSPFQKFLRGDIFAMSKEQYRGAIVFFGNGRCADCHRGPALSSEVGATEDQMFFAVGFDDFNPADPDISGPVTTHEILGRGGFTEEAADAYKFKVPQLYNLADTSVFGHGASFSSVREVVDYKNAGNPQVVHGDGSGSYLDYRFTPLGLSDDELADLTVFLEDGLYDQRLQRYVPRSLPSGNCFPVADPLSMLQLGCSYEDSNT